MKLSLRKSWWWLTPLAVVLTLAGLIVPVLFRNAKQRRLTERITGLGGSVSVRWDGPAWLFHFASDACRQPFSEFATVSTWGPGWMRDKIGAAGIDEMIKAWDVADSVEVQLKSKSKEDGTELNDFPKLLAEVSRLSTLHELLVINVPDDSFDFRELPRSMERLYVSYESEHPPKLDFRSMPTHLKELCILYWNPGQNTDGMGMSSPAGREEARGRNFEAHPVDLSGLPLLRDLEVFEFSGLRLDDESLLCLRESRSIRELFLCDSRISDAGIAYLKHLSELESLDLAVSTLTEQGLYALTSFKKLKKAELGIGAASEQSVDDIRKHVSKIRINRIAPIRRPSHPWSHFLNHGCGFNGFDDPYRGHGAGGSGFGGRGDLFWIRDP